MNNVSIVIPAYNEEQTLKETVAEAAHVLSLLAIDYEIIMVNEGRRDETGRVAEALSKHYKNISVIHHPQNSGLGAALMTGFQQARYELLTSLPADGQINPLDIKIFLSAIEHADFVTTYRLRPYRSLYRRFLSWGLRVFIVMLFGRIPRQKVGRMFRREILSKVNIISNTAMANMELIIKAYQLGYRFKEVGAEQRPRTKGKSKISHVRGIWRMVKEMIQLRLSDDYRKFLKKNAKSK